MKFCHFKNFKAALMFVLLMGTKAFAAQVVIVSDIDDTIKRSHILGVTHGVATAALSTPEFSGMAELYTELASEFKARSKEVKIYYVSNAPEGIMNKPHEELLDFNKFPKGELVLAGLFEKNHKENVISKIIETENPETVIFLGDNGEDDVYVYNNMTKKYSTRAIKFSTYIRVAYHIDQEAVRGEKVGKPLFENQMGFATATEISYDLFSKDLIGETAVVNIAQSTLSPNLLLPEKLHSDTKTHLPYWYDCRDHKVAPIPQGLATFEILENHNLWLAERCAKAPENKRELIEEELKKIKR
ncbi:MAG: phosphatase domain-containing protein [Bacteriovorax sp.]